MPNIGLVVLKSTAWKDMVRTHSCKYQNWETKTNTLLLEQVWMPFKITEEVTLKKVNGKSHSCAPSSLAFPSSFLHPFFHVSIIVWSLSSRSTILQVKISEYSQFANISVFSATYSFCTMSVNVNIDCSSLPERSDILDFYRPKLQKFPSHHYHVEPEKAKQIDVSSTWKGLHLSHAYELQFWERATKAALESYLEESLITLFVNAEPEVG
jgi:hypothetical protein